MAYAAEVRQVWSKSERFVPEVASQHENQCLAPVARVLAQSIEAQGKLTPCLSFNIETYCQYDAEAGSSAGNKGVSRVVLVNELGQRVFDTQVRLINPSPSSNRQQA